jgi:hypothetical protein
MVVGREDAMGSAVGAPAVGAVVHGSAVPLLWIVGVALIVLGVVALLRRSLLAGLLLVVVGILLGGLNVF